MITLFGLVIMIHKKLKNDSHKTCDKIIEIKIYMEDHIGYKIKKIR